MKSGGRIRAINQRSLTARRHRRMYGIVLSVLWGVFVLGCCWFKVLLFVEIMDFFFEKGRFFACCVVVSAIYGLF